MKKENWQLKDAFNYIKVNKFLFVFHSSEEYHLNSNINPFFARMHLNVIILLGKRMTGYSSCNFH